MSETAPGGRNMLRHYKRKRLGGGFGAEDALETGAGELDADELFALGLGIGDVDDAAMGSEVSVSATGKRGAAGAARGVLRKRNADFEVGANGDVEMRHEGCSVAAEISLAVSSSKAKPRASSPRTLRGRRTAILRSERFFDTVVLGGTMGWVLHSGDPVGVSFLLRGDSALEKAFDTLEDLSGRSRRMYNSTKLAAVPHTMSKPASELLHFAYTIGQVGSINLPIVVHQ